MAPHLPADSAVEFPGFAEVAGTSTPTAKGISLTVSLMKTIFMFIHVQGGLLPGECNSC